MFNQSPYNQQAYNYDELSAIDSITDSIIFNWFWLQNANIVTAFKDDEWFPDIDLTTFQNPVVDGWWILNRRYSKKVIKLKWVLKHNSASELQTLIDNFKLNCSAVEWFLDIKTNWIYRRTKATVVSSKVFDKRHFDITRTPYELTFETVEPFFYFRSPETISDLWVSADHNIEFTYNWTAISYPRIYFIFWTVSATDEISMTLNWSTVSISEAITTWDIVILDAEEKSVKLNWTEIEYTWTFPNLVNWSNLFEFEINETFEVDLTILYKTNFL